MTALNRRTQASYAGGAIATFTYDAASRLTQADDTADPHRPITRTYNALDRLLTETTTLGTVSYAYDNAGRRTQMTVGGQGPVSYTYDHNSRLRTITQAPLNPVDIQYDAMNRRTLLTLPNGVSTEYQYDVASRLTALIYRNALGTFGDLTYSYDANGNRIGVGGSYARTLLPDATGSATYDAGNRQLAFGPKTMTFDDNGNLLTEIDPSGTLTYTWDARNRLTSLSGPSVTASFAYDALGRRVRKTVNSLMTEFQYDSLDIVREIGGTGDASYLRTRNIDEALTRTDAVDTVHYLADALGSTVALTTPAGSSSTTYTYEPYGRTALAGGALNPVQYTGREHDGTGLYYYRARYYNPSFHRFLSEDPIGFAGGLNVFRYVRNSPVSLRDPLGLTQRDIDVAVDLIRETQKDLRIPQNIDPSMKSDKYAGEYQLIGDRIRLNQRYLEDLTDQQAADLLDTLMHETLHANDPFWKLLLDSFRDHPDIEKEAIRRSEEILERYLKERKPPSCK